MAEQPAELTVLTDWHKEIRAQFPILARHPELAYLDSAATAHSISTALPPLRQRDASHLVAARIMLRLLQPRHRPAAAGFEP